MALPNDLSALMEHKTLFESIKIERSSPYE